MTLTETRPPDTADPVAPPVERGFDAVLATGDHKRLGLRFAALGLLATLAGTLAAALFHLPAFGDAPVAFIHPTSRLSTAAAAAAFVIGIPALWIGLATYVVPLQIGGHRLALPRVHNLAWWLFVSGTGLAAIAVLVDETRLGSIAANTPPLAGTGEPAADATLLFLAALAVVAVGTLLAAGSLLTTVLNRRGEGVRLLHIPMFSWSSLSTSLVLLLTTPVFLAGLVLLYLDQRYGGTLFSSGAARRVWQHELWLLGRPESLVFFAAGIGIYCDIVVSALRRPLALHPAARAGAAAAPLFALLGWVGATGALGSPFAPFGNVVSALIVLPPLICSGTWLLSMRGGRPNVIGGVAPFLGHFLLDAVLIGVVVAGIAAGVEGVEADYFRNGQVTLFVLGLTVLGLAAGYIHWSPKLRGRTANLGQAGLTALLLVAGALLFAAPGYLAGLGAGDSVSILGAVGGAVFALGLLSLAPAIVGPAGDAPGDPYEGLTLEWAAASPPSRHNFDELPDVLSPYPLYDARNATGTTDPEGTA